MTTANRGDAAPSGRSVRNGIITGTVGGLLIMVAGAVTQHYTQANATARLTHATQTTQTTHVRLCKHEDAHPKWGDICYWDATKEGNHSGTSYYVTRAGIEGTKTSKRCFIYPTHPAWNVCE